MLKLNEQVVVFLKTLAVTLLLLLVLNIILYFKFIDVFYLICLVIFFIKIKVLDWHLYRCLF